MDYPQFKMDVVSLSNYSNAMLKSTQCGPSSCGPHGHGPQAAKSTSIALTIWLYPVAFCRVKVLSVPEMLCRCPGKVFTRVKCTAIPEPNAGKWSSATNCSVPFVMPASCGGAFCKFMLIYFFGPSILFFFYTGAFPKHIFLALSLQVQVRF